MEYPLIPMSEIRDEPREISVAWHEAATNWIGDKAKLASDIQNYADNHAKEQNETLYQNSLSMGETNRVLVERLAKYEEAISQIRSKILHMDDRNDFFIMGAFAELLNDIKTQKTEK